MDTRGLAELERAHGLQPGVLRAVMMTESGGNPDAVSKKGARGPFQLMPATAAEEGVDDPHDVEQAAGAAARLLRKHQDRFGGDLLKAIQAYNAGAARVAHRTENGLPLPAETQDYARKVAGAMPLESGLADEEAFRRWWDTHPQVKQWRQEFKGAFGEEPNPNDPRGDYDYRMARRVGALPQRVPDDTNMHWPSKGRLIPQRDSVWLKKEGHPTRWMEDAQQQYGEVPKTPEQAMRLMNRLPIDESPEQTVRRVLNP